MTKALRGVKGVFLAACLGIVTQGEALAEPLSARARVLPETVQIGRLGADRLRLELGLSQPVPWRLRYLDAPPRLVLDFREVDFAALDRATLVTRSGGRVRAVRAGRIRDGWTRLVLELDQPFKLYEAAMRTAETRDDAGAPEAVLSLEIGPDSDGWLAARALDSEPEAWAMPVIPPSDTEGPILPWSGPPEPIVVVLDPGHGGIDPGAERGAHTEAALMLVFARELREAMIRAGGFRVVLTRDADVFVPLPARIATARAERAHLFISLHADAIPEGVATGAAVYTLGEDATDAVSAALAQRHDRESLLVGADLAGQDDLVVAVLMDIARRETAPRTDALAASILEAISAEGLRLHSVPRRAAGFSVLLSPEIPSVLLELGYMSSPRDLQRLTDPAWRARMAQALVVGTREWAARDAALASSRRQ